MIASRSPALPMQMAVRAALVGSADLIAAFGTTPRVWDTVPVDASGAVTAKFPYITIGDDHFIGQTNQAADVTEGFIKVEAWSRTTDNTEIKTLENAIRIALSDYLPLEGHATITWEIHDVMFRREPDGLTRRCILTMRFQTSPATARNYLA